MIRYSEPVFRPPCEADSLILQVTLGCPHNKCRFCGMYKMRSFEIREYEEILSDARKARLMFTRVDSIFLADGNSISLNSKKLVALLKELKKLFPECKRISCYGGARFLKSKSPNTLREIREAGLDVIYLGLETGDDELLEYMDKGATAQDMIRAADNVRASGISLSVYVLLGLGGNEGWRSHAVETTKVLNAMKPDYVRPRTLALLPGVPLYEEGYEEADGRTVMMELLEIVGGIDFPTSFKSDHVSNYIPVFGELPDERDRMLEAIKHALEEPDVYLGKRNLYRL